MGLLDYYKQFEEVPAEETNRELREEAAARKARELARLEELDLSVLTWHRPPHSDVVGAITFAARRGLQHYPRRTELIGELAHRAGLPPERIALGAGASALMQAAASALMRPDQALVSPWPSHPLFPIMARRAHGIAVPVSGGVDGLLAAVAEHDTRVIALARPNDPTGELTSIADLERLLAALPETVAVLLDEALIEYAGSDERNASLQLLESYPRLIVFRSFSKAWGLAGLRCGYAACGPGAEGLLAEISPEHGIDEITQLAALESLRSCSAAMERRVQSVATERIRLAAALRERGFEVGESAANMLWVSHSRLDGGEIATGLARAGVLVASGAPLGEPRHVRIALRDERASERLLNAIDAMLD